MIGDLIKAFSGTPKYKPQYTSPELKALTDKLIGQTSSNLDTSKPILDSYATAIQGEQTPVNDAIQRYTDLAKSIQSRANNPLDEYKQLGDYLFSKADSSAVDPVINNLVSRTNLKNRVMGINPGIDSTYDRLNRAGVASKVRLSALSDILGQLGPTATSLNASRLMNDQLALGLTPQEIALRRSATDRGLAPISANSANLNDLINSGQGLSSLNQSNVFGYLKDRTGLDRWGDAFNALKDGAWEGLSFYQSLAGGGMGGGGGGGNTGTSAAARNNTNQLLQAYGQQQYPAYQGQGMNNAQLDAGAARLNYQPQSTYNPSYDPYYGSSTDSMGGSYSQPYYYNQGSSYNPYAQPQQQQPYNWLTL